MLGYVNTVHHRNLYPFQNMERGKKNIRLHGQHSGLML